MPQNVIRFFNFISFLFFLTFSGCNRSDVYSEYLLKKYLAESKSQPADKTLGTLLFLRERYQDWPAGKLAATLLKSEVALARNGYESECQKISRHNRGLLTNLALDSLKKLCALPDNSTSVEFLKQVNISPQTWEDRRLLLSGQRVLVTLTDNKIFRLWNLDEPKIRNGTNRRSIFFEKGLHLF